MRDVIFWLAVLSCACGQAMILRSAMRARVHAQHAHTPAGVVRPRVASEIAWTVLPAIFLAATLAVTWRTIHAAPAPMAMDDGPAAAHASPATPR